MHWLLSGQLIKWNWKVVELELVDKVVLPDIWIFDETNVIKVEVVNILPDDP